MNGAQALIRTLVDGGEAPVPFGDVIRLLTLSERAWHDEQYLQWKVSVIRDR